MDLLKQPSETSLPKENLIDCKFLNDWRPFVFDVSSKIEPFLQESIILHGSFEIFDKASNWNVEI
jgi:hypothetical protein